MAWARSPCSTKIRARFIFARSLTAVASSTLLAGGMLAFALSFDEVIVTTFTAGQQSTLPIWMLGELIRPRQRPVTNVVAVFVIVVTFAPLVIAHLLARRAEGIAEPSSRNGVR